MNLLWALQLQKVCDQEGIPITAMSLHPGFIVTEGLESTSPRWLVLAGRLLAMPVSKSGHTTLFAATSPRVRERRDEYKGQYLVPFGKVVRPGVKDAYDLERARELWEATEKIATELLAPRVVVTDVDDGGGGGGAAAR